MEASHKRKRDDDAAAAEGIADRSGADEKRPPASYLPCRTFQGARPGYYFRLGAHGPGYYLDQMARHTEDRSGRSGGAGSSSSASMMMPPPPPRFAGKKTSEELLAEAEAEAGGERALEGTMDAKALRKLVLSFERRYAANQSARMKHADAPEKFVDSEVDLDEDLKRLQQLAGYPDLYPEFVRLDAVKSVLSLLSHENPDIAADAVELIRELTDADAVESHEEGGKALVASIADNSGFELIVECLKRFGGEATPEEAAAVHDVLGIVENIVEMVPEAASEMCERTELLSWLLKRVAPKREADNNKLYAAEVLAIVVQSSEDNRRRLSEANGVDALLRAVAPYKSKDPADEGEEEVLQNLFDALCTVVMSPENKRAFVDAEGLELMLLMMKSKKQCRTSALKCVDYALTRCPQACERFVDILGLKTVFSVFMGKGFERLRKKQGLEAAAEEEERGVSVVASLFLSLAPGTPRHDRLCAKFVEDEYLKCDRLVELWAKYAARVKAVDARLANQQSEMGDEIDLDDDELYIERLSGGLYTLELLAVIFASVFATGHAGIRRRLLLQMELNEEHDDELGEGCDGGEGEEAVWARLRRVRDVLEVHGDNVGEVDGAEEQLRRKTHVAKLLVALGGGRDGGGGGGGGVGVEVEGAREDESAEPAPAVGGGYEGCSTDASYGGKECQTAGLTSVASDWAAHRLVAFLIPGLINGAWAAFLTLSANAMLVSTNGGVLTLTARTLSLTARTVGAAAVLGGLWSAHGVWTKGVHIAQDAVKTPSIDVQRQHAGWYMALVSCGMTFISGVIALAFGRGNVLGPTVGQLARGESDELLLHAITPRPERRVVGLTPRGEKVVRTSRAATSSETHRAAPGAFTRRDLGSNPGRASSVVESGGRGRRERTERRRKGGHRSAREDLGGAAVGDGKGAWEAFKARFWAAKRHRLNGGDSHAEATPSVTGIEPGTAPSVGPARSSAMFAREGDARRVQGRREVTYARERDVRLGRLTGLLSRLAPGGFSTGSTASSRDIRRAGEDLGGAGGGLSVVSHHLSAKHLAGVLHPLVGTASTGAAPSVSEAAPRASGDIDEEGRVEPTAVSTRGATIPRAEDRARAGATIPGGSLRAAAAAAASPWVAETESGEMRSAVTRRQGGSSAAPPAPARRLPPLESSGPPPVPPRRLPPLDLSKLSLRQKAEMRTRGELP